MGVEEAPTWPRGLPVCALLHVPLSAHQKALSLGWVAVNDFPSVAKRDCSVLKREDCTDQTYSVGWMRQVFSYYIIIMNHMLKWEGGWGGEDHFSCWERAASVP